MRRVGIVLGIVLMMSAPAWAQSISNAEADAAKVEAAKADLAKRDALNQLDLAASTQQLKAEVAKKEAARAKADLAKRDALMQLDLEASSQQLEINLQNLIAQAQAAPAAPAAPPRPAAARGAGVGAGNGAGAITLSTPFGNVNNRITTVFTNNSRSDNPINSLQVGSGTWWNNPDTVTLLGLTKDQQKKMDEIFQNHRIKLIDLNASLSKEEAILEPLIAADRLDESKILVQIDKIAQARAELEKDNSRLLLSLRQTLTMDQWTKVQTPANSKILQRRY